MTSQLTPSASITARQDAVITRAEQRLVKLERLSDIGMELAEEIRERNVGAPYHPEPKHDSSRAFANVSRAVRLTIVLEGKINAEILAMSKGEWPCPARWRSAADRADHPPRAPVGAMAGAETLDAAEREVREQDHECLTEYENESYEEFLDMRLDDCLATIRSEFGLRHEAADRGAVSTSAGAAREAGGASALQPPGGAASPGPVDDPPCAQTFPSRPAWPTTGPPHT